VTYIHGFENCVQNIVGDADAPCTAGAPARSSFGLIQQLERASRNALLVCPEVAFDTRSADPGHLGQAGGFRALLTETFARLRPLLGPLEVERAAVEVVASHSGGYRAAAAMATIGGVEVAEVWLLDSLYGETTSFDGWVEGRSGDFDGTAPTARFADVYTAAGGTLANSQAMATRAHGWFSAAPGDVVDDRSSATWPDETYRHGLLFKQSALTHDGVARYYFEHLLATSRLPTP
jgi:hypothetical protein